LQLYLVAAAVVAAGALAILVPIVEFLKMSFGTIAQLAAIVASILAIGVAE